MVAALTAALAGPTVSEASASSLDPRCRYGRVVCVDKSTRTVKWVVNGSVRLSMSARFGSSRTPTRNGSFRIYWKDRYHVSSLFGSPMPFSLFYNGGQAIHYSYDFARNGYGGASHGCVNTRNWSSMRTLYYATRVGDRVVVYWS
jgi:lipoprotein-anchoring transpeptidase ErfK/SrfK